MVIDAMLVLAHQTRQDEYRGGAHIAFQRFRSQPDHDNCPNQARWHGVNVTAHMDRGKARNGDAQFLAGGQRRGWQGAQDLLLSGKAGIARLVAFVDQILQKLFVGRTTRKIPAPSDSQRLVNGLLETMMGLFHIPVFMRHPSIVPGGLHPVVLHEGLVAKRPIFSLLFAQLPHSGAEMVSAVLLWNSTKLPERFLDPLEREPQTFR